LQHQKAEPRLFFNVYKTCKKCQTPNTKSVSPNTTTCKKCQIPNASLVFCKLQKIKVDYFPDLKQENYGRCSAYAKTNCICICAQLLFS
jgi:hypothetical protein